MVEYFAALIIFGVLIFIGYTIGHHDGHNAGSIKGFDDCMEIYKKNFDVTPKAIAEKKEDKEMSSFLSNAKRREAYRKFIEAWGVQAQMTMVLEETAELQKEVCKHLRGRDNRDELIEEIADCLIMIEQLEMMLDVDSFDMIEVVSQKIQRTLNKLDPEVQDAMNNHGQEVGD